jgi:hypothetical protein
MSFNEDRAGGAASDDQHDDQTEFDVVLDDEDDDEAAGAAGDDGVERLEQEQRSDEDDDGAGDLEFKQRRRDQKRAQKERARKMRFERERVIAAQNAELRELRSAVADLQGARAQGQGQNIDAHLRAVQAHLAQAEQAMADAVDTGDGQAMRNALHQRDRAQAEIYRVQNLRAQQQHRQQQPTQPQVDRITQAYVKDFQEANPWLDLSGKDADSKKMLEIDQQLANEGLIPSDPNYWAELEARGADALPHRFRGGRAPDTRRGGPPVGGRSQGQSVGKQTVRLTAERVKTLKDLGVWGTPEAKGYIAEFAKYDRENAR